MPTIIDELNKDVPSFLVNSATTAGTGPFGGLPVGQSTPRGVLPGTENNKPSLDNPFIAPQIDFPELVDNNGLDLQVCTRHGTETHQYLKSS